MKSDFLVALTQLAAERGLPKEIVLSAIEAALVSAYKKDSITSGQNISVKLDPGSGGVTVNVLKTVVETVEDDQTEILKIDAEKLRSNVEIGEHVITESMQHNAGRIAAQTAKQVVMQRLREAEREIVFMEYEGKEGEVFSVTIQRVEPKQVVVDLGRAEAVLTPMEQVLSERYRAGNKMKVLLKSVERAGKGPELIVSRADSLLLRRLFEMEVPEIFSGTVEIESIAREPGSRSKVAVRAKQDGVDPVGSCVGLRGVRIQNIVNELHGEKIDVVEWNKDLNVFIASALSPAQVMKVEINADDETAMAVVPERQLSLAIGKEGQNARLAARLTGWNIDIKSHVEYEAELEQRALAIAEAKEASVKAVSDDDADVVAAGDTTQATDIVEEDILTEVPPISPLAIPDSESENLPMVATTDQIDQTDKPTVEPEINVDLPPEALMELEIEPEPEPEPAAAEASPSLHDLPEDIWSVRRARRPAADSNEPGQIRFAEDIAGLRGGVTASRRGRRKPEAVTETPKRKTKAGKRRR